ncbi:hypothetical protein NUU98_17965 [Cronobacter sakazakii]|uniref:hypothetical protein n=1 Tax=Cronobacter sakazakii TaxID=28141 RepID=UPI0009B23E6A|nr:hypothetical protein [Cronobacter sakazakii]MDQ1933496.1 hypothetical protein [Cronobacter sakazakii]MDQ1937910.1 hypothetical protein [Cronobacter sakazakii]MDQ1942003.1 hypothetical protein [Cronobacter sakazakii]MDQ1946260.1 hypothetical protein [Cronobacter sakazakii]MDQ1950466.1 hypothetical protein [Cronobacter sakazakii]
MAKFTDVHDLLTAYQKQARKVPAKGVYASKQRRDEVQAAHARRVIRQRKRSVGKSNKLGGRRRAEVLAALICEMNFWAIVCRSNRKNASQADEVCVAGINLETGGEA